MSTTVTVSRLPVSFQSTLPRVRNQLTLFLDPNDAHLVEQYLHGQAAVIGSKWEYKREAELPPWHRTVVTIDAPLDANDCYIRYSGGNQTFCSITAFLEQFQPYGFADN